ncbi:MAG TPA: PH domain-containing protein [Streptosporangiaceae bacterium]|nr:PH domain-containing protein [Streptosporangiaceae bacterium]
MRQPRSGSGSPVVINKYLLPREVQVATVRQHPAVLIPASAQTLIGLLIAGVLSATVLHGTAGLVLWILWLVLLLRLIWKIMNWSVDYFVVTSERLLLTRGFLTRQVNMMPLTKVTDMSFKRSFAGRLFGYGEFIVESAGQDQALRNVEFIPYPEQLYLLICGMLFPSSADDMEDGDPTDGPPGLWDDPDDGDPLPPGPDDDVMGRKPRPPVPADEL